MDDFTKYRAMRTAGAAPPEIYRSGKADGLDEITLIRLLRNVCNLSLRQAKEVGGAGDVFDSKQEAKVGAVVHWEGWDSVDGLYLMQARVAGIVGDRVRLEGHRRFRVTPEGLEEVSPSGIGMETMSLRYFDKTLAERIGELLALQDGLARLSAKSALSERIRGELTGLADTLENTFLVEEPTRARHIIRDAPPAPEGGDDAAPDA